jgi:hypothetical protein
MDRLRTLLARAVAELEPEARTSENPDEAARRFLKTLDPDSQEGMWFAALAEGFRSPLEAARVYVRDVKRARRLTSDVLCAIRRSHAGAQPDATVM